MFIFSSKLAMDIYGVEMCVIPKVYSQNRYVSYFDLVGYKSKLYSGHTVLLFLVCW